jgi:uncharacterized protein (DUF2147 family)
MRAKHQGRDHPAELAHVRTGCRRDDRRIGRRAGIYRTILLIALGIARQSVAASLLAIFVLPMIGIPGVEAARPEGEWIIKDVVLTIFDCEHLVCGRIAWLKDPARRPLQCGKTIVWGLTRQGPNEWTGGSIFDPDDGLTYQLSAKLQTDDTLNARIFKGVPVLARTEVLRRIDIRPLSDRC